MRIAKQKRPVIGGSGKVLQRQRKNGIVFVLVASIGMFHQNIMENVHSALGVQESQIILLQHGQHNTPSYHRHTFQ